MNRLYSIMIILSVWSTSPVFGAEKDSLSADSNPDAIQKVEIVQTESGTYYYHSNQVGSVTHITDGSGEVYQHLEYFPYGETFVEERNGNNGSDELLYQFNGKEKDETTELNYYGTRYYDAGNAAWLSVDPLSDQFPGLSPYNYTLNNPVKFTDPDGKSPALALAGGIVIGGGIGGAWYYWKNRNKKFNAKDLVWSIGVGSFIGGITGGSGAAGLTVTQQLAVGVTAQFTANVLDRDRNGEPPDYWEDAIDGATAAMTGMLLQTALGKYTGNGFGATVAGQREEAQAFFRTVVRMIKDGAVLNEEDLPARLVKFASQNTRDAVFFPAQVTEHEFAVAASEFLGKGYIRLGKGDGVAYKIIGEARAVLVPFFRAATGYTGALVDEKLRVVYVMITGRN